GRPAPSSRRVMSRRSPYLSPGLARRRRRVPFAAGGALLVVILVAALVVVRHSHDDNATRPSSGSAAGAGQTPLQLANGPVTNTPGPRPLTVKLDGTRDTVHLRFKHPPRSGLMFDLDTGQVLWRHAPERVLPIASVTKMMTALIVVSREPPSTM